MGSLESPIIVDDANSSQKNPDLGVEQLKSLAKNMLGAPLRQYIKATAAQGSSTIYRMKAAFKCQSMTNRLIKGVFSESLLYTILNVRVKLGF